MDQPQQPHRDSPPSGIPISTVSAESPRASSPMVPVWYTHLSVKNTFLHLEVSDWDSPQGRRPSSCPAQHRPPNGRGQPVPLEKLETAPLAGGPCEALPANTGCFEVGGSDPNVFSGRGACATSSLLPFSNAPPGHSFMTVCTGTCPAPGTFAALSLANGHAQPESHRNPPLGLMCVATPHTCPMGAGPAPLAYGACAAQAWSPNTASPPSIFSMLDVAPAYEAPCVAPGSLIVNSGVAESPVDVQTQTILPGTLAQEMKAPQSLPTATEEDGEISSRASGSHGLDMTSSSEPPSTPATVSFDFHGSGQPIWKQFIGNWIDIDGNHIRVCATDAWEIRLVASMSTRSGYERQLPIRFTKQGICVCGNCTLDIDASSMKELRWNGPQGRNRIWVRARE